MDAQTPTLTRRRLITAALAGAGAGVGTLALAPTAAAVDQLHRRADHVVLIALDGFDSAYLGRVPMPNLQALARRGSLTTSTGVMTSVTNPSWSSVATGAWPERTGNLAYWWDPTADVVRGQTRSIAVPTLGQTLREHGLTQLSVQWFIEQDYGVTYGEPDALYVQPGGDLTSRVDVLADALAGRPVDSAGTPVTLSGIPDMIGLYSSDIDGIGHATGADSPEVDAALAVADVQLGRVVDLLRRARVLPRTAFVLTGDHGMTSYDQRANDAVSAAISRAGYVGEILFSGATPHPGTTVVVAVGGVASLHLRGAALEEPDAVARLRTELEALPEIEAVLGRDEQRALHMDPRMGELVLEPTPGWGLTSGPLTSTLGRHGTRRETAPPLLLAGAGIRPGAAPEAPRHVDLAPTIAALLGVPAPAAAQGRVLTEALR